MFPWLYDPLGTKTCSDNQTNTHEIDKTVILHSQAISLLEDPLSRHSRVVILSSMDKTVCLWLVVILTIWKFSIKHGKLPNILIVVFELRPFG